MLAAAVHLTDTERQALRQALEDPVLGELPPPGEKIT